MNNRIFSFLKQRLNALSMVLLLSASITGYFSNGCSTNVATGERHFNLISESQEIQIGKESDQQVMAAYGNYDNQQVQNYVQTLGKSIAALSERPNLPWSFKVIDDPMVNAFALPGGFIYVTRGILTHMNNEAELVGVLGHEIGHVTAKHSVYSMSKQQLAQIGFGVASILEPELAQQYGQLASAGLQLLFLKFGRDDEREADQLGVRYMERMKDDPHYMINVMQTLEKVSQSSRAGKIPQWLSTHPDPGNRIALIKEHIDTSKTPLTKSAGNPEFVSMLEGMTFGENPREGFFRGTAFYHPDMKFTFTFPSGWQTINTKQAVIGVSPNQDAMIQIMLAQGNNAQSAAQQFFGQQGMNSSGITQLNVHGIPGVIGNFSAQTQQGVLTGTSAFINYNNQVFQILSYGTQAAWSGYQPSVVNSINTFNKLDDPAILNVQPNKIKVITITNSMTIEQFNQQYPSVVPLETIALINGVDKGATLTKGQKVKQVVGQKL